MPGGDHLYIETVRLATDEQISLHLTRHLPQRLSVGNVVIIHQRPAVLLAVIRKRWMHIIREIEREHSSTLDRTKRYYLQQEIHRMRSFRFSAKLKDIRGVDALLISYEAAREMVPCCFTMYILDETIPYVGVEDMMDHIEDKGLLVRYEKTIAA
jgi:hypothetical protein